MTRAIRLTPEAAKAAQERATAAWGKRRATGGPQTPRIAPNRAGRPELRVSQPAKRSKHGAVKVTVGNERFDSKLESRVWADLKLREAAGEIRNLRRQVRFSLFAPGGEHLGTYAADFVWHEQKVKNEQYSVAVEWERVVADAKSPHTRKLPGWNRTKTLMQACHNITVIELP